MVVLLACIFFFCFQIRVLPLGENTSPTVNVRNSLNKTQFKKEKREHFSLEDIKIYSSKVLSYNKTNVWKSLIHLLVNIKSVFDIPNLYCIQIILITHVNLFAFICSLQIALNLIILLECINDIILLY